MEQYHQVLKEILSEGDVQYEPRTETYMIAISGYQNEHDMNEGFPLVTTKNVPPRLPFEELFWKLRGERNVKGLVDRNVHIWTKNAFDRYLKNNNLEDKFPKHTPEWNEEFKKYSEKIANDPDFARTAGDLGPVYGYNWRYDEDSDGNRIDQLEKLLKKVREEPGSRYHVLNAWNVSRLKDMALGPCPFWHQFTVFNDELDLHMVQRSCDTYLGVPFNKAQDALMLEMVAKETGLKPRKFIHTMINTHLYLGVSPRADFWTDDKNVETFKNKFNSIKNREDYLGLKEWYLKTAPVESEGNEKKDHVPFVLEQLSKEPRELPSIELKDIPLMEAIHKAVGDVVSVEDYNPHKWDSRATMAA